MSTAWSKIINEIANNYILFGLAMIILIALIALIVVIIEDIVDILSSPFDYPYYYMAFDVSGKRNPDIHDYIDKYLCNPINWNSICKHELRIERWKARCQEYVSQSRLKKRRERQFQEAIDDRHAYQFVLERQQTRYRQSNYIRSSYQVTVETDGRSVNFAWLNDRHKRLSYIGYETSLRRYNEAEQRKLMTPQLRRFIMRRDNYTCQICGKYMPDGVGLQIDHIIPISKGGKTVPSNLRVLCSKCNGRKGSKLE